MLREVTVPCYYFLRDVGQAQDRRIAGLHGVMNAPNQRRTGLGHYILILTSVTMSWIIITFDESSMYFRLPVSHHSPATIRVGRGSPDSLLVYIILLSDFLGLLVEPVVDAL